VIDFCSPSGPFTFAWKGQRWEQGMRVANHLFYALDKVTCELVREARYTPARDLRGNPTSAHNIVSAHWVIPRD
jgi:hypothetical protein